MELSILFLFLCVTLKFPSPMLAFIVGLVIDFFLGTKIGATSAFLLVSQLGIGIYSTFAGLRIRGRVVYVVVFWLIYFHVLWRHLF